MPSAAPKPVIVCADDFACSEGVSRAIVELARLGRLGATSAMVLSPRWAQDAALLAGVRGSIDVGLHLDWTSSFAVAAGHGVSLAQAMRRALGGGFRRADVERVIAHQLDAFERQWRAAPDHVDGHQHVHQFSGIREPLLELLDRRYGRGHGPYVRVSLPAGAGVGLKGWVVGAMGARRLAKELAARGRPGSAGLLGLYGFDGTEAQYAGRAARWLSEAAPGAVLMCHPAMQADAGDAIGQARLREFAFWRSDAASAAFRGANAVPARGPAPPPCDR